MSFIDNLVSNFLDNFYDSIFSGHDQEKCKDTLISPADEDYFTDPIYYEDPSWDSDSDDDTSRDTYPPIRIFDNSHNVYVDKYQYNLKSPTIKLTHQNSILLDRDINQNDIVSFRIDRYYLNEYLSHHQILYSKFLKLITPSIKDYILKFVSQSVSPIKLSIILSEEKIVKFGILNPILKIWFNNTLEIQNTIDKKISNAIDREGYTNHDWIYPEDKFNILTIIQERLINPNSSEDNLPKIYPKKTFKEDKCIICRENDSNILFCDCDHMVICEECFNKLRNGKCPKCRTVSKNVRKL